MEDSIFDQEELSEVNDNVEAPDVYEALLLLVDAYIKCMEGNRGTNEEYNKRKEHASNIISTSSNQIASLRDEIFAYSQKLYNIKNLIDIKTWALSKQTQIFEKCLKLKNQSLNLQYQISLKEKEVLDFVRNQYKSNYISKEEMAVHIDGHPDVAYLKLLKGLIDAIVEFHTQVKWQLKAIESSDKVRMEFEKEFNLI